MGAEVEEAPRSASSHESRMDPTTPNVNPSTPGTATGIASTVETRDYRAIPGLPGLKESSKVQRKQYNTSQLGFRIAADGTAALAAGALVAPVITMIDSAIIENASGKRALLPSLQASLSTLLLRPHRFLASKPFLLILALYGGTYFTANTIDTTKSVLSNKSASTTSSGASKFVGTSAANLSLCLYKDSQFTRLFGTGSARPVPGPTYALFAARDCLTIFASFNLPPLIAPLIPLSEAAQKHVSNTSAAQFMAPAAMQVVSTPLHLLGLDLYNRNERVSFRERLSKIRVDWFKSTLARMARIIPAFGVGGVVNTRVRSSMMRKLE